jgi:uncharacterized Zn finger protein (UPF0148 family)
MGHTSRQYDTCEECGQPLTPSRAPGELYCKNCGFTQADPRRKMGWRDERKRRFRDDRHELPL